MSADKVDRTEVKKYFLLADAGKELFAQGPIFNRNELQEIYSDVLRAYNNLQEEELDEHITDKVRLDRYNSMDWYRCDIALGEMGPWPRMKGLPIEFTIGNIPETARMLDECKKGNVSVLEERMEIIRICVKKVRSIITNIDFVRPNFPLILFPGGEIREKDYNVWARENGEPLCRIFRYDIDDGSERAVAYASSGLDKAPVYFGVRN